MAYSVDLPGRNPYWRFDDLSLVFAMSVRRAAIAISKIFTVIDSRFACITSGRIFVTAFEEDPYLLFLYCFGKIPSESEQLNSLRYSGHASFIIFTSIRSCLGALIVSRYLTTVSISFAVKGSVSVVFRVSFMFIRLRRCQSVCCCCRLESGCWEVAP